MLRAQLAQAGRVRAGGLITREAVRQLACSDGRRCHGRALARHGGDDVNKAIAVIALLVLILVIACAPAAPPPTRTPEPTPTPVEVLATKPEHFEGIWFGTTSYQRWDADGTIRVADSPQGLDNELSIIGTWWFEDGMLYEDSLGCEEIGVYRVYLRIREGRAVRLRQEVVEDPCLYRRRFYLYPATRVD
jgi:hypothetical protein